MQHTCVCTITGMAPATTDMYLPTHPHNRTVTTGSLLLPHTCVRSPQIHTSHRPLILASLVPQHTGGRACVTPATQIYMPVTSASLLTQHTCVSAITGNEVPCFCYRHVCKSQKNRKQTRDLSSLVLQHEGDHAHAQSYTQATQWNRDHGLLSSQQTCVCSRTRLSLHDHNLRARGDSGSCLSSYPCVARNCPAWRRRAHVWSYDFTCVCAADQTYKSPWSWSQLGARAGVSVCVCVCACYIN